MLTASKVAKELDITVTTLTNWYKWYLAYGNTLPDVPKLPSYTQETSRSPRYWNDEDLPKIKLFQQWIPKGRAGVMGMYNAKFWGERGKRAIKNKTSLKS